MDGGAWWAAVHGVAKSQTQLSDFTFTLHFHALEKEMATRSSVLAWRIPGTGEAGGLPSMGSHRVGHDWSDLAAALSSTKSNQRNGCLQGKGRKSTRWVWYLLSQKLGKCFKNYRNMSKMYRKQVLKAFHWPNLGHFEHEKNDNSHSLWPNK